jgi:hypothetical protein
MLLLERPHTRGKISLPSVLTTCSKELVGIRSSWEALLYEPFDWLGMILASIMIDGVNRKPSRVVGKVFVIMEEELGTRWKRGFLGPSSSKTTLARFDAQWQLLAIYTWERLRVTWVHVWPTDIKWGLAWCFFVWYCCLCVSLSFSYPCCYVLMWLLSYFFCHWSKTLLLWVP